MHYIQHLVSRRIAVNRRGLLEPRHALSVMMVVWALLVSAQTAQAQPIKVMPFGDIETKGHNLKVGYRYPLWYLLTDAGFDIDFVGSQNATQTAIDTTWYPDYDTTFDRDHEGWFDTQTDVLITRASTAAETFKPDIVLIMAGFVDVWYGGEVGVSKARTNLPEIIDRFREQVPGVTILLSQVPPYEGDSGHPAQTPNKVFIEPLNEEIAHIANEMNTQQSPIYLVDNHTGFDRDTMFCCRDFNLPNPDGERWIASNFFEILETVLPGIDTSDSDDFQINSGLNDAWYNPATAGQGFLISVFPQIQQMFVAWFTYDTERPPEDVEALLGEPGHRWVTAQGSYSGDTASLNVFVTEGGIFDAAEPTAQIDGIDHGTITIEFADCTEGLVTYEMMSPSVSGEIPIQRIANDNVALCEDLAAQ